MMDFMLWIETFGISTFVRESGSLLAFPTFLFVHTLGISIVAGGSLVISLAFLGLWPQTPLKPLVRLYPVIWFGFIINLITGLGLLMADASTKGMNPVFWVKMAFVIIGVVLLSRMRSRVFDAIDEQHASAPAGARALAWGSLVCWFGAIVAGRLIAYVGPTAGV